MCSSVACVRRLALDLESISRRSRYNKKWRGVGDQRWEWKLPCRRQAAPPIFGPKILGISVEDFHAVATWWTASRPIRAVD